jgi:outer membrane protein assembly factor BamB
LSWSWHHPGGRFHTLPYGTAIDDQKNIYLTTDTAMWKFGPTGNTIWTFTPNPKATIFSSASLLDGRVHFTTLDGRMWAISMETGEELWSRKVCDHINYDNGFVTASEGVMIGATDASMLNERGANGLVRAVNATDGSPLWTYKPNQHIWNFMASYPGDGTVLYQDWEGRAYRHHLNNGSLIWMSGGDPGSWTDGTPLLANGVFYTVSAFMGAKEMFLAKTPGFLQAYRLEDGKQLWKSKVKMPPNNAPAFGKLPGHTGFSVVQPGGWQGVKGGPTGVFAYDAATGELQWSFSGPSQKNQHQAGELEGMAERKIAGASTGYVTNPWSAATMDADGTVYVGHEDGLIFALQDANGDGSVQGEGEVDTFDTGAAFVGSSGPAHAPGMLAVASCDSLYVFSADETASSPLQ